MQRANRQRRAASRPPGARAFFGRRRRLARLTSAQVLGLGIPTAGAQRAAGSSAREHGWAVQRGASGARAGAPAFPAAPHTPRLRPPPPPPPPSRPTWRACVPAGATRSCLCAAPTLAGETPRDGARFGAGTRPSGAPKSGKAAALLAASRAASAQAQRARRGKRAPQPGNRGRRRCLPHTVWQRGARCSRPPGAMSDDEDWQADGTKRKGARRCLRGCLRRRSPR